MPLRLRKRAALSSSSPGRADRAAPAAPTPRIENYPSKLIQTEGGYLCICRRLFYFRVEGLLNWIFFFAPSSLFSGQPARTSGGPVPRSYPPYHRLFLHPAHFNTHTPEAQQTAHFFLYASQTTPPPKKKQQTSKDAKPLKKKV